MHLFNVCQLFFTRFLLHFREKHPFLETDVIIQLALQIE